jgi:transglutaminase-like putative cysteine protease
MIRIVWIGFISFLSLAFIVPLYAVPATLSLPRGQRPGVKQLSISQAAQQLKDSKLAGMALVEAARALIEERMTYSRRNSFDSYERAFARGYGYCVQQSYALVDLLRKIGFDARVVQAFRNRFPSVKVSSHAWVRVVVDGQIHDLDTIFYDADAAAITFEPVSDVTGISPLFKAFTYWGATAVNSHRYYLTGKDQEW